jgi:hypothetical protein
VRHLDAGSQTTIDLLYLIAAPGILEVEGEVREQVQVVRQRTIGRLRAVASVMFDDPAVAKSPWSAK